MINKPLILTPFCGSKILITLLFSCSLFKCNCPKFNCNSWGRISFEGIKSWVNCVHIGSDTSCSFFPLLLYSACIYSSLLFSTCLFLLYLLHPSDSFLFSSLLFSCSVSKCTCRKFNCNSYDIGSLLRELNLELILLYWLGSSVLCSTLWLLSIFFMIIFEGVALWNHWPLDWTATSTQQPQIFFSEKTGS